MNLVQQFQNLIDPSTALGAFLISLLAGVVLILFFVKTSDDLLLYVLCHSATLFLGNLSMWTYIPGLVGKVKVSCLGVSPISQFSSHSTLPIFAHKSTKKAAEASSWAGMRKMV